MEATLRDVLVISGNAAISAALVAHDLNVIPVDPTETPGWAEWAAAAHLLVLDLGDADRAVDAVTQLRSRAVATPALVVAESVTDSPRLVSLRLADQNVKTLSWPLTPERLVRAVERAMSPDDSADEATSSPTLNDKDRAGVQWPTFDPESFEQSSNLDWRTAFTVGLDSRPAASTRVEIPPPAPVEFRPEPPRAIPSVSSPVAQATPASYQPAPPVTPRPAPQATPAPYQPAPSVTPQPAPAVGRPLYDLDLPPVPTDDTRKHRLAPWARPRPGATSRFDAPHAAPPVVEGGLPGFAPLPTPAAAPPAPTMPVQQLPPPPVESPIAEPRPRPDRAAARAAEKAREAAEKMQARALAAAEKEAARARAAAEKEAARAMAAAQKAEQDAVRTVGRDRSEPVFPAASSAPEVIEQVRLIPAAPTNAAPTNATPTKVALRAAAEAERAEKARLEAEAKAAERAAAEAARSAGGDARQRAKYEAEAAKAAERAAADAARAEKARLEAEGRAAERAAADAARAEKARLENEAKAAIEAARNAEVEARQRAKYEAEAAKAAERAAADAARAEKARLESEAKAAIEAARNAEVEARQRAKYEAEAAKAAERAAAIAARAAAERAAADQRAAAEAEKAIEKARLEAGRIAEAQARADEKAAREQAEVDAKFAQEAARAAERTAAEMARADERARAVAEREALAQAKVDSKLAAEAAKAARLQAEVEAHQAAVRAREEAEQARVAAKLAAEASRVETIARVKEAAQHTKIRAEADQIVGDAVRKAEEDFSARALANRPVYYGPELEPPGLGYVHQLMAMTESLASPAEIAEELAFVAMEHLAGCEAVAVMIPDGDCWTTASGIGVGRSDLRYRLAEEHWFVRHVLGEDEIVLIDDPEALRDELSGVPLTGWRYLVGLPLTDANSMLIAAGAQHGFQADAVAEFVEGVAEYVAELAESLSTRDVARQIHERGGGR